MKTLQLIIIDLYTGGTLSRALPAPTS